MTTSEKNALKFFSSLGIEIKKVPESTEQTPDYLLIVRDQPIFLEVKEIDENPKERSVLKDIEKFGESGCYDSSPLGKRFRSKIVESNKQLKKKCKNNEPGIALIQDVRSFFTKSIDPQEEIKQAMFGDRVIWRTMPSIQNSQPTKVTADIFSANKTTTAEKNTTISAVGFLAEHYQSGDLLMFLYHNPFARNPIEESLFSDLSIKQFKIGSTRNYCEFVEIENTK